MRVHTAYGTVYGIETVEEAERIIAKARAEADHEGCPECRGVLSLDTCIDNARAELAALDAKRHPETKFSAREVYLLACIDAYAALQPKRTDPMGDTSALFA
jgi:hypothetical protein